MATVTIRNLSDEVVAALKERARRNSRSMEAEVRDMLVRSVRSEESASGVEDDLARRLPPPRRWTVRGDEVMAWIDANPLSDQQRRTRAEWAAEIEADRGNPVLRDTIEDPWEQHDPR
ncbi:FitA-like ribbon-helix-helix domain-containing protein [Microbacterium oxydans]|uniref:Antitoxin FitA-like ribbon-helix-helix domain-containing protein n=1 Tax=Microbacterium oxydans TaxID=82380 RepID=A0A0F0L9S7_9MICO|nr:hypothetical protein [Microbacterium oxydans]KJL29952.1 hypothetical protein RS83_01092 [Microbacterium oxydans]